MARSSCALPRSRDEVRPHAKPPHGDVEVGCTDAGCGNNRLEVLADGVTRRTVVCASARPGPAAQINIGSGNGQRVDIGAPASEPLRVCERFLQRHRGRSRHLHRDARERARRRRLERDGRDRTHRTRRRRVRARAGAGEPGGRGAVRGERDRTSGLHVLRRRTPGGDADELLGLRQPPVTRVRKVFYEASAQVL